MNHIKVQAEALKPGDSMSINCARWRFIMVQKVGADRAQI